MAVEEVPRCSEWARSVAVDPIGTAGSYAGFLLIEWSFPWPRDVSEIEALAGVHERLAGTGIRVQLLARAGDPGGPRRVALFRRDDPDWFAGYAGIERIASADGAAAEALDLIDSGEGAAVVGTDVLICGHGKRDVCCGAAGTALALTALADPDHLGRDVRVWRTSHTGGHRFAPTAIVLPAGTMWGFLDERSLRAVVRREGPAADQVAHYRGCTGIGSPAAQGIERAALAEAGWSLLEARRRAGEVGGRIRLEAQADRRVMSWEGTVRPGRTLPVPQCGEPIADAPKSETEIVVETFARTL